MVLINGAEGIGTGWSTYIPNYSPRQVAANLLHLLRGEPMEDMQPWWVAGKGQREWGGQMSYKGDFTSPGVPPQQMLEPSPRRPAARSLTSACCSANPFLSITLKLLLGCCHLFNLLFPALWSPPPLPSPQVPRLQRQRGGGAHPQRRRQVLRRQRHCSARRRQRADHHGATRAHLDPVLQGVPGDAHEAAGGSGAWGRGGGRGGSGSCRWAGVERSGWCIGWAGVAMSG